MVDLNLETAKACRERYGLDPKAVEVSTDYQGLLASLKPDVVFDCTIPAAHHDVVMGALEGGCHVLGEKPMAETLEQAQAMVAAAKTSGKLHAVMQNRRYMTGIRSVQATLKAGAIGEVHTVNCDFYMGPHFGGFREQMQHILLLDMSIHSFDQARFLLGDPQAERVYCHEFNPPNSWFAHGASAQAIFQMSGGVSFNYRGSWCAEGFPTDWECQWRLIGTKGTLLWDGNLHGEAVVGVESDAMVRPTMPVPIAWARWPDARDGHKGCIHEFLDCVQAGDGREPLTVGHNNIHSLAMVVKAVESAESGQAIALSP